MLGCSIGESSHTQLSNTTWALPLLNEKESQGKRSHRATQHEGAALTQHLQLACWTLVYSWSTLGTWLVKY